MTSEALPRPRRAWPQPAAVLELFKPITWFAPMWALACGVVSSGRPVLENIGLVLGAIVLAGPLVCGTSQVVNDWFDRHVDAINEPHRPIPSGRVPGQWGLGLAIGGTIAALVLAAILGPWILVAGILGLCLAWAYSAPPFRLKGNGWFGNAAVGLCYEGLPWFTGAGVLLGQLPPVPILALAGLYSLGAHGIMILNDFKAVEGDREMNVRSIPVQLGVAGAVRLACVVMAVPQVVAIGLLWSWDRGPHAAVVGGLLLVQLLLMRRWAARPKQRAAWYNATGTTLFVLGMMVGAQAVRTLNGI
ncbi:MAG: chlorophyll synthase ChlG [Myxococcota bacterium]